MEAKETPKTEPAKIVAPSERPAASPVRDEDFVHMQAHDAGVEAVARALEQVA